MYTARVEEWFAAAHFLKNFHGKCENLHGHNYRVRVTVKGTVLDEGGMLCDFGILKDALKLSVQGIVASLEGMKIRKDRTDFFRRRLL